MIQRKLRAAYWNYLEDIITPTDNNDVPAASKRFWSFIKHSKSDATGIPPLKKHGLQVTDAAEKAEVLNDTFQSVFSPVPMDSHPPRDICSPYPDMLGITITDNINPNKAGVCYCACYMYEIVCSCTLL